MVERQLIPRGSAVVLDYDHDFTYYTAADNEVTVLGLASGIAEKGLVAAIARPFRLRKMGKLVGIEINPTAGDEEGFAEIVRPLTTEELAHELATVNATDINRINFEG